MQLSIIIVSWNTKSFLIKCLDSILAYPPDRDYDIWVVDNASRDGTSEHVGESYPMLHLIENSENMGFARGNNQAFQCSKGRYILILNPDTEVKAGLFEILLRFMDTHLEAGAVGPLILNSDYTLQTSSVTVHLVRGLSEKMVSAGGVHPLRTPFFRVLTPFRWGN